MSDWFTAPVAWVPEPGRQYRRIFGALVSPGAAGSISVTQPAAHTEASTDHAAIGSSRSATVLIACTNGSSAAWVAASSCANGLIER